MANLKPNVLIAAGGVIVAGAAVYLIYKGVSLVAKAIKASGDSVGNGIGDFLTTGALGRVLVGAPVAVSGSVILPSGSVITLQQVTASGSVAFDPRTEQTTFVYGGVRYRFTGQNDSSGRRVAVRA